MPPKPGEKPIVPTKATLEQIALQLAAQRARAMRNGDRDGSSEREYQIFNDFFDSIHARCSEERHRDMSGQNNKEKIKKDNIRAPRDRAQTWTDHLNKIDNRRSGLRVRLNGLARALNEGDAVRAKAFLTYVVKELNYFASDYTNYRNSAAPYLMKEHPELQIFTELWENGEFKEGRELEQVLNTAAEAAKGESKTSEDKGESKASEDEVKKPIEVPQPAKEEELEDKPFNINEFYIENERKKDADQRFKARTTHDIYSSDRESYESLLGSCEKNAKQAGREVLVRQLAKALTAAKLRREGKPYNADEIEIEADNMEISPGFAAMSTNTAYMRQILEKPEDIDKALDTYLREQEIEQNGPPKAQSYDEYLRRHTWPNVPEGMENEYLAKSIAAHRLASNGYPFNLETIRSDAKHIQKQGAFKEMTTEGYGGKPGPVNVRRWLNRENLQPASHALEELRKERIEENKVEPKDPNVKSWAGYRRMHTTKNVPANATASQKRMYLAKAAIAIRGMGDDQDFTVKGARKLADKLMKNKYFLAATKDPERVDELLKTGNVTQIFSDMSDARRRDLSRRNPDADVKLPKYEGQEYTAQQPPEQPQMSF